MSWRPCIQEKPLKENKIRSVNLSFAPGQWFSYKILDNGDVAVSVVGTITMNLKDFAEHFGTIEKREAE